MALDSLASQSSVAALQAQISSLQTQLTAAASLIVTGDNAPATTQQTLTWLKTNSGIWDGVYRYSNGGWFTPMPYSIGMTILIANSSPIIIGFVASTNAALPVIAGFTWYEFTGANLLILNNIAYRQSTQSLLQ